MKNRRKIVLVPLAAAAVTLAFASVAYACTVITGSITTKNASGTISCTTSSVNTSGVCFSVNPGDSISSRADGLTSSPNNPPFGPTSWSLYFLNYKSQQDGMKTCMGKGVAAEKKIAGPVRETNDTVDWTSARIPSDAQKSDTTTTPEGPALVCWIDSDPVVGIPKYNYATPATELNVL